jgi:hypothetical protein
MKNNTTTLDNNERKKDVHFSAFSLLAAASFFSLRFRRNDGVRNFDFFSFFTSSPPPPLLPLVRVGET